MKLITKIVGATLGLALAVGVGVGVAANNRAAKEVNAAGGNNTQYSLITSTGDLEAGKSYLITSGTSGSVATMAKTSNTNNRPQTTVSVSNSKITRGSNAMSVTLEASSTFWKIKAENYATENTPYFTQGNQTGSNYLKMAASGDDWSISFSNNAAVITSQLQSSRNIIRYNSNSSLFSCYTSGQNAVYLFKEVASEPAKTIQANSVTIKSGNSVITGTYEPSAPYSVEETIDLSSTIVNYQTGNDYQDGSGEVNWNSSAPAVATISNSGIVTFVGAGTTTITATAADKGAGNVDVSASFILDIRNVLGGANNPYSVAQARAAIDANKGKTGVYATGIVSRIVTAYDANSGQISYNISSDGLTTSDQLQAYRGKSFNGENFTSADDIKVGAVVVVRGNLKKYSSTYEFDSNNQLVSYTYVTRYDITFDSKGGSSVASQKVVEGEKVQIPTPPTRDADQDYTYTFAGWYTDQACTNPYDFDNAVNSSFTLFAKWDATPLPAQEVIERDSKTNASLAYHYSKTGTASTDTLTNALIGNSGNSYTAWAESITGASGAVYTGKTAAGNDAIQLNTNNTSKPGIVTTTSGGTATKVRVVWNENTADGRTINIYGKNTAYSAVSDLYDNNKKGTLIGSISYGTNTVLEISDSYAYIGIYATGALYADSISVKWGESSFEYSDVSIRFSGMISTSLWDRLANIEGYGFMISYDEDLGGESLEEWYRDAKTNENTIDQAIDSIFDTDGAGADEGLLNGKNLYKPLSQKAEGHPDLANDAQKAGAEGDQYIWYLNKTVLESGNGLTKNQIKDKLSHKFTAVAYIRTTTDVVFFDEITASVLGLASSVIERGGGNSSTAGGSLIELVDLLG